MISGLQKMTLLDFPGKVACTVFLQGCNFRCPFCHNSDLLGKGEAPFMTSDDLLAFLTKRVGLLDGVCVSGGEPTLSPDLEDLLKGIKALGFAVKLDTNGSNPTLLKKLVSNGLVDYVAMDVKNSPAAYPETVGLSHPPMEKLEESMRFLMEGTVPYEFRTTVVAELHSEASIQDMGQWLFTLSGGKKLKQIYLQKFENRESVLLSGLHSPEFSQLQRYQKLLNPYFDTVAIRGE